MQQITLTHIDFTPFKYSHEQRTYKCGGIESHLDFSARDIAKNIPEIILPTDACGLRGLYIAPKIVNALHSWKFPPFAGLNWTESIHADRQQPCLKLLSDNRTIEKYSRKYAYDRPFMHFSIHYPSGEFVFDPIHVGISPLDQIQNWGSYPHLWQYMQCTYLPGRLITKPYHPSPDPESQYNTQEDKKVQLWVIGRLIENGFPDNITLTLSSTKKIAIQNK